MPTNIDDILMAVKMLDKGVGSGNLPASAIPQTMNEIFTKYAEDATILSDEIETVRPQKGSRGFATRWARLQKMVNETVKGKNKADKALANTATKFRDKLINERPELRSIGKIPKGISPIDIEKRSSILDKIVSAYEKPPTAPGTPDVIDETYRATRGRNVPEKLSPVRGIKNVRPTRQVIKGMRGGQIANATRLMDDILNRPPPIPVEKPPVISRPMKVDIPKKIPYTVTRKMEAEAAKEAAKVAKEASKSKGMWSRLAGQVSKIPGAKSIAKGASAVSKIPGIGAALRVGSKAAAPLAAIYTAYELGTWAYDKWGNKVEADSPEAVTPPTNQERGGGSTSFNELMMKEYIKSAESDREIKRALLKRLGL